MKDLKGQIISFAKAFYAGLDFAHNIKHGERVAKIAKRIGLEEKGDPFLIEAGAWLHQFHDNIESLNKFLSSLDIKEETKAKLSEIVRVCRPNKINETSSIEAKIVFDADAIEVLGPYGTVRELLCNAVVRKKSWIENVEGVQEGQEMFERKLMTRTGKRLSKELIKLTHDFWDVYNKWEKSVLEMT